MVAAVVAAVVYGVHSAGGDSHPPATADEASGAPPGGPWTLRFDEEFNGTTLDASKWNSNWLGSPGATTPPVNPGEKANYSPGNVRVSGGYLHLVATATPSTAKGQTRPYTSGIVTTHGLFQFQYGYAEARMWVSGSSGTIHNWPSFWTVGNGPWPVTGEDDILEGGHGRPTYHFNSSKAFGGGIVPGDYTGWHLFASDWEPGSVTYYWDGRRVGRITEGVTSAPMFLVLNLAVGGSYSGPVVVPSTMLVDYVRVWQH